KVILTRNIGFADKEAKKPITSETAFEIGSLTKQFTAAATMLLVEEERLSLDDRILSYLDSTSGNWSAITVRQLLTHTSGIKDYTGVKELKEKMKQEFLDPKEVIQVMQALPLN
ncbi:MAG: beta-lactamase family protein, partial [Bacteroidetes bacterium]